MSLRGVTGWHTVHAQHFGEDRWQEIHHALHKEAEHLCFVNPFLPADALAALEREYSLTETSVPGAYSFAVPEDPIVQYRIEEHADEHTIFVESERDAPSSPAQHSLSPFFFFEGASAIVALALGAEAGDEVLDVCAAPGGKALVVAAAMYARSLMQGRPLSGKLVCNEVSKEGAARMQHCMRHFLPAALFDVDTGRGPHVIFTSADASSHSNSMERNGPYDKILLDAPCTKDRQLLRGSGEAHARWSRGTTKVSSERQLKWLHNALWLLKEGGVVLYCTTALSPDECDGVIERAVRKAQGSFRLELLPLEEHILRMIPCLAAEPTEWGTRILPDKSGFGPLYFSRLRMVQRTHAAVEHLKW